MSVSSTASSGSDSSQTRDDMNNEDSGGLAAGGAWRAARGRARTGRHGGPIAFVGGRGDCIGWRVRRWELLEVADLEIFGRCAGRFIVDEVVLVSSLLVILFFFP